METLLLSLLAFAGFCLFAFCLGAAYVLFGLMWAASGSPDVNGDPERDASSPPIPPCAAPPASGAASCAPRDASLPEPGTARPGFPHPAVRSTATRDAAPPKLTPATDWPDRDPRSPWDFVGED